MYGWREGSVGEGLAPQSHGPEFGFPKCQEQWSMVLVLEQGGKRQGDLGASQFGERPCLKK